MQFGHSPMSWSGWGDPARRITVPDDVRALLVGALGLDGEERPPVDRAAVRLRPPALDEAVLAALHRAVGAEHVRTGDDERLLHAGGKSLFDLLRRRAGDATGAPDAVVTPGGHAEVAAVLGACSEHRVAVVPFGGGTSVVGGVEPRRGRFTAVVALDLRRLDSLCELDETDRTATLEAGVVAPRAEALLGARGWTLGHVPQSYEHATIGGFAATRSAGQASTGLGRFDDLVEGLRVATPAGDLDLGRAPGTAAGPDLRQLLLGSEGMLGVITEVTVRIRPVPEVRRFEGWRVPSFTAGAAVLRELVQERVAPDVARLSDEAETALGGATGGARVEDGGCLVITGWEGAGDDVQRRRALAVERLEAAGAAPLGEEAGTAWVEGRFRGPYLRDALLDLGVLAETLETATSWSRLAALHTAVGDALRGALADHRPLVMCHVSHLYPAGASLYFTVVCALDRDDPLSQWSRAKRAAGDAIVAHGATITHHHAVGTDHAPWMAAEVGDLGVEALRAVKRRLDPVGILNPGKLLPEDPA